MLSPLNCPMPRILSNKKARPLLGTGHRFNTRGTTLISASLRTLIDALTVLDRPSLTETPCSGRKLRGEFESVTAPGSHLSPGSLWADTDLYYSPSLPLAISRKLA